MLVMSPEDRPARIEDRSAWTAADFPDAESYRRTFSREMIAEIEAAARPLLEENRDPKDIAFREIKLPVSEPVLSAAYDDVENGQGFAVLAGLPVDDFNPAVARYALAVVGCHFGDITRQNREGEYVLDVMDKSTPLDGQNRGYHSNAFLEFHNDGSNVVALLCMETAKSGGESLLISASTIYNEISQSRPDLMPALMRGYRHSRRNQKEPGEEPVMADKTPVFSFIDGVFHNCYSRISIESSFDQGVSVSDEEREALDYFSEAMMRPDLALAMEFRKGDIQLVNNFSLLHSRNAFVDHSADRRRHLIRLWLTDPTSRYNGPGKADFYVPKESRFLQTRGYGIFNASAV